MKSNIFKLDKPELDAIADALKKRIYEGLKEDGKEIKAFPTYITPTDKKLAGKVLALEWGGTNFRAAVVEFVDGKARFVKGPVRIDLGPEKVNFKKREEVFGLMAAEIDKLGDISDVDRLGFCFSYSAVSQANGDIVVENFSKGIEIPDMIGKHVGQPMRGYLNDTRGAKISDAKVINDTVACLFAGLDKTGYDSYIGLIVGTGYNMAYMTPKNMIGKLTSGDTSKIPVNLEAGNFTPPFLTTIDNLTDATTNNRDEQRFEKAVSGGYLGMVFKTCFMNEIFRFEDKDGNLTDQVDGAYIAGMLKNPGSYPAEQVEVAREIYDRSAKLVAAGLAGVVRVITEQEPTVKKIYLAADGSVFWGELNGKTYYKDLVDKELDALLPAGVSVTIGPKTEDPNLIGAAIAALS